MQLLNSCITDNITCCTSVGWIQSNQVKGCVLCFDARAVLVGTFTTCQHTNFTHAVLQFNSCYLKTKVLCFLAMLFSIYFNCCSGLKYFRGLINVEQLKLYVEWFSIQGLQDRFIGISWHEALKHCQVGAVPLYSKIIRFFMQVGHSVIRMRVMTSGGEAFCIQMKRQMKPSAVFTFVYTRVENIELLTATVFLPDIREGMGYITSCQTVDLQMYLMRFFKIISNSSVAFTLSFFAVFPQNVCPVRFKNRRWRIKLQFV